MRKLTNSRKDLAPEYNAVLGDGKEDFLSAEVNSQIKTVHEVEILSPVIIGYELSKSILAAGATEAVAIAAILDGVTAVDALGRDITENLEASLSPEFVEETAGTYGAEISVADEEGAGLTVGVEIVLTAE